MTNRHDFTKTNDESRMRDLLAAAPAPTRERALRFLDINEADGQYPYVADVTEDGHVYIVGEGGTCVVCPDGTLDYAAHVEDGQLVRPSSA